MLIDGLLFEHQCRLRAVAATGAGGSIVKRSPFIWFLLGKPIWAYRSFSKAVIFARPIWTQQINK
jgi:hypothetical protein